MDPIIAMAVLKASEFLEEAKEFYRICNRNATVDAADLLVVAFCDDELAGMVRLCFENETYVLRSMQIREDYQRRGIGTLLLDRFDDLLKEKKIHRTFCMPYDYLQGFYGQIGFRKIQLQEGPAFLQQRVQEFQIRNPGRNVILMLRGG